MSNKENIWKIDQFTKSQLFHQKLHEWEILEIAEQIEKIKGENLEWNLTELGISQIAWNKAIHRGIKPVIIFAHPEILTKILKSVSYYRMLAMVSQKSMVQIGLTTTTYEQGKKLNDLKKSQSIAEHLNNIISYLIEADEEINIREFDLWRRVAAGSQAQGSWQKLTGEKYEIMIKNMIHKRVLENKLFQEKIKENIFKFKDEREIIFANEPDLAIYKNQQILVAVEIKGGIDKAGVLERIGASIKSLSRTKEENSQAITILLLQGVSIIEQAKNDLCNNKNNINYWFNLEEIITKKEEKETFFSLLNI